MCIYNKFKVSDFVRAPSANAAMDYFGLFGHQMNCPWQWGRPLCHGHVAAHCQSWGFRRAPNLGHCVHMCTTICHCMCIHATARRAPKCHLTSALGNFEAVAAQNSFPTVISRIFVFLVRVVLTSRGCHSGRSLTLLPASARERAESDAMARFSRFQV